MHFLLSFFLFVMPVSAQQQEEAPIRRIDPEVVMNDISARLNLSGRQIKKLRKDLEGRTKKFDKNMKIYDKNLREEMKYHERTEESKSVMKALSDGVNDNIREYLDDQQQVLFDQYLAEKEKDLHPEFAERQAKEAASEAAAVTAEADAPAPVTEEAKTLAEKKKRVVLKKKNRKRKAAGAGNVVPAGLKGAAKKKVSRKTEADLPATVMPPAASSVPSPVAAPASAATSQDPLADDPLSSGSSKPAGGSAVPSL